MSTSGETANGSLRKQIESHAQEGKAAAGAQHEAKAGIAAIGHKAGQIMRRVKADLDERPYAGMAACVGVGFVLGALFGSRAFRLVTVAGVGYLLSRLPLREFGETLRRGVDEIENSGAKARHIRAKHA